MQCLSLQEHGSVCIISWLLAVYHTRHAHVQNTIQSRRHQVKLYCACIDNMQVARSVSSTWLAVNPGCQQWQTETVPDRCMCRLEVQVLLSPVNAPVLMHPNFARIHLMHTERHATAVTLINLTGAGYCRLKTGCTHVGH